MENFIVPHDADWASQFEREAKQIASALGDNLVAIHHIGSTAIPGLTAKPVIDILVEVNAIDSIAERNMISLGYNAKGEFGIEGRRFFQKLLPDGTRTHHVHIFQVGSAHIARHIAFRNFLISHKEVAAEYADIKTELAESCQSREEYINGKSAFVKDTEKRALVWFDAQRQT